MKHTKRTKIPPFVCFVVFVGCLPAVIDFHRHPGRKMTYPAAQGRAKVGHARRADRARH